MEKRTYTINVENNSHNMDLLRYVLDHVPCTYKENLYNDTISIYTHDSHYAHIIADILDCDTIREGVSL